MQINKNKQNFIAIILAGGLGRRMASNKPKILHPIGEMPMILRTIETIRLVNPHQMITVANPGNLELLKKALGQKTSFAIQKKALGTADAVKSALPKISTKTGTIAVVYGDDSAFYKPSTISNVYKHHLKTKAKITFVTLNKKSQNGLGRILRTKGHVTGIIEEKDASPKQKEITEVNDGLYFFESSWLRKSIAKIDKSPITGEYYLTNLINYAAKNKDKIEAYLLKDSSEWHGINTPQELISANELLKKRIHIMGIGGAGASAVAAIAKRHGFHINGCDIETNSAYRENLRGITVDKGHSPDHLHNVGILIVSAAVLKNDPKNPEIVRAKKHKIPVLLWEQFQSQYLLKNKMLISVSGAYGKSTTTGMIAQMLDDAGLDPTCEIGAKLLEWKTNFKIGKGQYYVLEADEYLNKFLFYNPDIAVILNIGWDHPDFFKTQKSVENSYKKFITKIKPGGALIITANLAHLAKSVPNIKVIPVKSFSPYSLSLLGDFRTENADAAMTLASALGLDKHKAKKSIENFTGLARRLEKKGRIASTVFYDDYAVQPITVKKTAQALKRKFPKSRILLVFEPHTFSRINTFFTDFVEALKKSEIKNIYITDVYPAREKGDVSILSKKLVQALGTTTEHTGPIEKTAELISTNLKNYDIVLTMGAGNVYKIYDLIQQNDR